MKNVLYQLLCIQGTVKICSSNISDTCIIHMNTAESNKLSMYKLTLSCVATPRVMTTTQGKAKVGPSKKKKKNVKEY